MKWVDNLTDRQRSVLQDVIRTLKNQEASRLFDLGCEVAEVFERKPRECDAWVHVNVVNGQSNSTISIYRNDPGIEHFIKVRIKEVL